MVGRTLPLLILAGVLAGCAGNPSVQPRSDATKARVTWEIRVGGEFGDRDFVCGAAEARRACELTASTAKQPVLTTVRLYLHAAAVETSYLGVVHVPFVQQAAHSRTGEANVTVPPGSRPVGVTVSGRVTRAAGSYTLTVAVDSVQAGAEAPLRFTAEVPVTVLSNPTYSSYSNDSNYWNSRSILAPRRIPCPAPPASSPSHRPLP